MKWAVALKSAADAWAFVASHRSAIAGGAAGLTLAVLAALSIELPTAHYRAIPVLALAASAFVSGFFASKAL